MSDGMVNEALRRHVEKTLESRSRNVVVGIVLVVIATLMAGLMLLVGEGAKAPLLGVPAVIGFLIAALSGRGAAQQAQLDFDEQAVDVVTGAVGDKREEHYKRSAKYFLKVCGNDYDVPLSDYTSFNRNDMATVTVGRHSRQVLLVTQQEQPKAKEAAAPKVVERVVVREIVKVPCPYCDTLVANTESLCPQCGGQIR